MTKFLTTTAIVVAALAAAPAVATTWKYTSVNSDEYTDPTDKGVYNSTYIYQDTTERFALSFEVKSSAGVDGFWFVVNNGPMPVGGVNGKYAIMYSDLTDVWAYQYQGKGNNNGSYNKSPVLQKYENAVQTTTVGNNTAYSMLLNVAGLNAAPVTTGWQGLRMDDVIGTWLHPTLNTFDNCAPNNPTGKAIEVNGDLNCFSSNNWIGWDEEFAKTMIVDDSVLPPVPVPAGLPLLLAGLGAFGLARRYKKA